MASDLTKEEQDHVRASLRFLFIRLGNGENLAKALHFKKRSLYASMSGHNTVGPGMAFA